MKRYRFSLMAGLLAIGAAACGDDVEVVQPTPPQPPPPPPLQASMTPASAEVMVGSSVVFAVNASGGVVGEAATWSCASSNTGIATVTQTSAGCQATGVAAGGVTITASVSKSGETANVGAQLTVTAPPAPPPFEASIAPESQSVAVGSSVVFAVNTSGGDMMMAASWTCASSDPAIATVETTDAGCQATGVAGGEVTVNVAATDGHDTINLVAQLTVTADPVDPVQPFSATMAPASATVAVGSNAVFAINTSGGAADATASWVCSSSDDAVATAETTDAGCQATGVAAGGVTINAAVTKGDDSANLASQLTVTAPDVAEPAFVFITNPTDGTSLEGDVSVTISVERGDQVLEGLSLLVDDEEVAHQSFGGAHMSPADGPAEQAPLNFTLSFDSGEYDRETGAVTYLNGDHTISAELEIVVDMADGTHGHASVLSNNVSVEFDNDDFITASVGGLGDGAMNEESGQVWHGGPDVMVEITAVPVLYSSGDVSSLTLLSFCGDDAATDSEAPFSFTLDCDGYTSDKDGDGDKPTFTVGGDDITARASAVYLDFDGPPAPHFNANPNGREGGWINQAVLVATAAGRYHATRNKDGWLVYNDDGAGVGGYQAVLRFSSTTPSIVDGARGGAPNALPTEPTRANAACVIATAVDLLGNESSLPRAGSDCVTAANYEGEDDEGNTTYAAGIRAGLDVSAPTIAFSPASPRANASSLREFQVQVADAGTSPTGRSGLHSMMPVLSKVDVRDADNDMLCGDDDDVNDGGAKGGGAESVSGVCELAGGIGFNDPLATTDGLSSDSETGYYTFTAVAQDKAGNRSEPIVRTAVNDGTAPDLGLIVGGYSRGAWSLTATLTDNLSLKSYWAEAFQVIPAVGPTTGGILILPREGSVAVDEYNSADLTQSLLTTPPITMQVFRALQPATAAGTDTDDTPLAVEATLDSIQVVGTDHGGQNGEAGTGSLGSAASLAHFGMGTARTQPTGQSADQAEQWNDNETTADPGVAIRYSRDEVFQSFTVEDDEDDDDALELRAMLTGTRGYMEAVAEVLGDNPATDDVTETDFELVEEVQGVEGLVNNPVSRVDFYAAVELDNVGTTANNQVPPKPDGPAATPDANEALVLIGSASAAGAEDFMADPNNTPNDATDDVASRRYVWALDMSGADFVEKAGGEGNYTIVAIAVNSAGVAIAAITTEMVED